MFFKRIFFITLAVILCVCIAMQNSQKNPSDDFLDEQLLMLKNQAFCNCVNKAMKEAGATLNPRDGTNYMQISELDEHYWFDPNLERIINVWSKKEYISYDNENKLYFMRCLDFYNSKDLANYIDSVRTVEKKKNSR